MEESDSAGSSGATAVKIVVGVVLGTVGLVLAVVVAAVLIIFAGLYAVGRSVESTFQSVNEQVMAPMGSDEQ